MGGADSAIEDKAVQEGLTNVQERVDCMLNTAAATLLAITFGEADGQTLVMIAADFVDCVDCDAEAQSTKPEPEPVIRCGQVRPFLLGQRGDGTSGAW